MKANNYNILTQKLICVIVVLFFFIKWIAWRITHSVAIFTDALEGITNILSSFIGFYSLHISTLPKDRNHPYGHGKIEFISTALEGFFIIVSGAVIITENFFRWQFSRKEIQHLDFGIFILLITSLINYIVGTFACYIGKKNYSLTIFSSGKHLQVDAISTLGVLISLTLLCFTGWAWIDMFSSIVFSLLILYIGIKLLRRAAAGVMDESDEKLIKLIVNYLDSHKEPNWIDLHNLKIIKYGSALHIDAHFTIPWFFNIREAHNELDIFRFLLKKKFGDKVEFFIHIDPCTSNSCSICSKKDCLVRSSSFKHKISWTLENISKDQPHSLKMRL